MVVPFIYIDIRIYLQISIYLCCDLCPCNIYGRVSLIGAVNPEIAGTLHQSSGVLAFIVFCSEHDNILSVGSRNATAAMKN